MPGFRRRSMALRPINSNKEIIDGVFIGVAAGVVTALTWGLTINDYIGGVGSIPLGSKVNGVYFFINIQPQAAVGVINFYITKFPSGAVPPIPGVTGGDVFRKFILHEEKGLPGVFNNGSPPFTFRGVVVIPKGRRRWAEGDLGRVQLTCSTAYDACVKAIYKVYR